MKEEPPLYYILVRRVPFAVDVVTWGRWFGSINNRRVGEDIIGNARVSTVFLGIDHNFLDTGDPVLFETMVFGGPLDQHSLRYCTWKQAEKGHAATVAEVKKAADQIAAIADAAGVKHGK